MSQRWLPESPLEVARARLERAFREAAPGEPAPRIVVDTDADELGEVRLSRASLARDCILVGYQAPFASNRDARVLACSFLAWDGPDACEPWRELARPIADLPRIGRIDEERPWFLAFTTRALDRARHLARDEGGQLHVLLERPSDARLARDVVYWPAWRPVVFALLGRAAAVVPSDRSCPFGLDAERAGVPVHWQTPPGDELAGLVVPSLLASDELWRAAATNIVTVRAGGTPTPLSSAAWIQKGRMLSRAEPGPAPLSTHWELVQRRYAKFRREPERYFADSRHALVRAFGRAWYRR